MDTFEGSASLLGSFLPNETSRLVEGLSSAAGDGFLRWLVSAAHHTLGVDYAFVGELTGEDQDRVHTLALHTAEGPQPNVEYSLADTPCAEVVGLRTCSHPRDVATLFPKDTMLADMGFESYVGTPLHSGVHGRTLGLFVALGTQPLSSEQEHRVGEFLERFRPRAVAELERRRALRDLHLLIEAAKGPSSEASLQELVRTLAKALGVRAVALDVPVDGPITRVVNRALCIDGTLVQVPGDRSLAGTRCEILYGEGKVCGKQESAQMCRAYLLGGRFEPKACLGVLLRDGAGQLLGNLCVFHDRPLDERLREQPLFQAFTSLVAAELERDREQQRLLALERRLQEALRGESLGALAGGIAHDFNNYLAGILAHAELAQRRVKAGRDPNAHLDDLIAAGESAAELCNQLLAYAGGRVRKPIHLDLGALVSGMSGLLEAAKPSSCRLRVESTEAPVWVYADPSQLQQVVLNLITNGAEAIGKGGGEIKICTGTRTCTSTDLASAALGSDLPPGDYAFIEVTDSGKGMDPATLQRIFDPYFSTKAAGRGLGLATVRGVLKTHEAALRVQSRSGAGTTFTVFLPINEARA